MPESPADMPLIRIESPDDPRLAPYRDLPNKQLSNCEGRFIAEGNLVVRRLLDSRYAVESVLIAEPQRDRLDVSPAVPVYVAPTKIIEALAGFRFHRGILGCGLRPAPADWSGMLPPSDQSAIVVVCSAVRDPQNLGGILRNCAAFGVDLVMFGDHSADPFSRRVLRVSMATALKLNLHQSAELHQDLIRLRDHHGIHCMASVLDPHAQHLADTPTPRRLGLVLGNELSGLDASTLRLCQSRVTVPMSLQTDSLNVAVASGIFLYHFNQLTGRYVSA